MHPPKELTLSDEAHHPPAFTPEEAVRIAAERFRLDGVEARPLPSDRDQNFVLRRDGGPAWVLKLANAAEDPSVLDFQTALLEHLALRAPDLSVPSVHPAPDGALRVAVEAPDGHRHLARVLTWLPGRPLAEASPHTPELLRSAGALLGRLDRALEGFEHPGAHRTLDWDLRRAPETIRRHLDRVASDERRALIRRHMDLYESRAAEVRDELPLALVHNDGNGHNLLVGAFRPDAHGQPGRKVAGIIDFGDALRSWRVAEPAVAAAYAMLDKADPVGAAAALVAGYHGERPLEEAEARALYPLALLRLCLSVVMAARQKARDPDNPYLTVTEAPAWDLLARLREVSPDLAHFRLREACGLPPCPAGPRLETWLDRHGGGAASVVDPDLRSEPVLTFDLSVASRELSSELEDRDAAAFSRLLLRRMEDAGVRVAIGRWDEPRRWYAGPAYEVTGDQGPERRTIHLGVDFFMPPGSTVRAPFDGTVRWARDNDQPLDYGPTVILEHRVEDDEGPLTFWTLYGHLSRSSLEGLRAGREVAGGEAFAELGDVSENGGWPPHLHFQVIGHMLGEEGNFPGVAAPSRRAVWRSISPDPGRILGVPGGVAYRPLPAPEDLLARRRRLLGPSLSLSYRRPLVLVRGSRQHLFDDEGRAWLDAVNNVPHVGHAHPRVVRAARRQAGVLETNTRYLHPSILELAERLTALLPEPLSVCFFVNSGSEANELALRMARAHTGARELVVVEGGYHGNTSTLVELSPYKFDGPGGSGAVDRVQVVPMPDPYRGLYRDAGPEAGRRYAEHVAEAASSARERGGLAAFLAEPLIGCGGQIVPPEGWLAEAFRHVRAAGGVCIADEIQVGFGRVGTHMWASEAQGAVPDILTLGKPMGNGHPLGAVVTTPEIAASFDTGMEYFNTFGGNPVSCVVGLAVLDVLEEEGLQANALEVGGALKGALTGLMERHDVIGDVRGAGLYLGVELVEDRDERSPAGERAAYVAERMKDLGVLLSTDGPDHNVLKIKPPMCFGRDDASRLVKTLDRVLGEDFVRG